MTVPADLAGASGETVDRGRELLGYTCSSARSGRELTLFGNGTLRLRQWTDGQQPSLDLVELSPVELDGFLKRLEREIEDGPVEDRRGGISGENLEQCSLAIELPALEPEEHRFGGFEAVSLALARRVRIVEELLELTQERRRGRGFPRNYRPRSGDVLLRADGARFRVVRHTLDGQGVEIMGIEQPLLLYMEAGSVAGEFSALLSREADE